MIDMSSIERARRYMHDRKMRANVTSAVVVAEALNRKIEIRANRRGYPVLSHGSRSYYFSGGSTDFNSVLAKKCARYKEITSRLLRANGLPAPESAYFAPGDLRRAWQWAKSVRPVVVKPSNSTRGKCVHVRITRRSESTSAFSAAANAFGGVLVEPFCPGTEHRVLFVNCKVIALTKRVPANVTGDGRATVAELIDKKNGQRSIDPIHKSLSLDELANSTA